MLKICLSIISPLYLFGERIIESHYKSSIKNTPTHNAFQNTNTNKAESLPLTLNTENSFTFLTILSMESVHFLEVYNRAGTVCSGHLAESLSSTAMVAFKLEFQRYYLHTAMLICFLLFFSYCC